MSGISVATCISLIKSHIGGIPLMPAFKVLVEGAPPTKQILGMALSLPSLGMLQSALGGSSLLSTMGDVFQNPIGGGLSDLTSSLTSAIPNLNNISSLVPGGVAGILSGGSISPLMDTLKSKVADLGSILPNISDITNKMSGVTLPIGDGDFGLSHLSQVTSTYSDLASNILNSDSLSLQVPGLASSLNGHLDALIAPLNLTPQLFSAKSLIDGIIPQLSTITNNTDATSIINQINSNIDTAKALIKNPVDTCVSTMNSFMKAGECQAIANTVTAALQSEIPRNIDLITKVTKPAILTQFQQGIDIAKQV